MSQSVGDDPTADFHQRGVSAFIILTAGFQDICSPRVNAFTRMKSG